MPKRIKKTPCEKCPLYERKEKHFIKSFCETDDPKWMIISDLDGSSRGLNLLNSTIADIISPTYNVPLVTYAVKCWPGDGVEEPPAKSISLCREAYLDKEIDEFKGNKVVLLGKTATHSLYRGKRAIRNLIGMPLVEKGKQFLSVWNPADFFKFGNKQILSDIERAIRWAIKK